VNGNQGMENTFFRVDKPVDNLRIFEKELEK